jgi:hypothetical protein
VSHFLILALLASGPTAVEFPDDVFARPFDAASAAYDRFLAIVGKDEGTSTAWQAESRAAASLVAFGPLAADFLMMAVEEEFRTEFTREQQRGFRTLADVAESLKSN